MPMTFPNVAASQGITGTAPFTVATTDATVTTLGSYAPGTGNLRFITVYVKARRTGGAAGTPGDVAGYMITATVQDIAGTASVVAQTAVSTHESQAGWDATLDASGANIRIRITGAASNNINWEAILQAY